MAIQFPSTSVGGERWSRRASAASGDFQKGIQAAAGRWQPAAAGAQANYEQGVTAAIAKKAFAAGVNKAGDAKWVKRASEVGPARFSQGVTVAQPEYEQGVGPIWSKVAGTVLASRGPRRSEGNYQRAVTTAKAFATAAG